MGKPGIEKQLIRLQMGSVENEANDGPMKACKRRGWGRVGDHHKREGQIWQN